MPLYVATGCVLCCTLSSNARKSLILESGCFHHCSFGVPWIRASHMTRRLEVWPKLHREGRGCMRQYCSSVAERRVRDWALRLRSSECDAERCLLVAGSWDCDWRRSNVSWHLLYVLVNVSWENAVARLRNNESVRPYETFIQSSDSWHQHLTPSKHLSRGWYNPARFSFCATS